MQKLDLKLGIGCSMADTKKQEITEDLIKVQAIELVNKHKEMNYNFEEDNLDLYTSYFSGPSTGANFKKQLKMEFEKKFKL